MRSRRLSLAGLVDGTISVEMQCSVQGSVASAAGGVTWHVFLVQGKGLPGTRLAGQGKAGDQWHPL